REEAEDIPTPILAQATTKPAGISFPTTWQAELLDKKTVLRAVLDGKAPQDLVDVNMTVAHRYARSLRQAMNYPGLKAVAVQSVAGRRR
ncbi:MAG: hypothetical protein ACREWE_14735, partial [Gammaproteobacteria bacterium]